MIKVLTINESQIKEDRNMVKATGLFSQVVSEICSSGLLSYPIGLHV